MLYSFHNQYPQPIPDRIRLSSGITRTDSSTFTAEEIADAGYVLVSEPPTAEANQVVLWDGSTWVVRDKDTIELVSDINALKKEILDCVQKRLDDFASTRGYGDEKVSPIVSACSYALSSHAKYGPEGRYCLQMREQTWDVLYGILADVEAGVRPTPTSYDDIASELPFLHWPDEPSPPLL